MPQLHPDPPLGPHIVDGALHGFDLMLPKRPVSLDFFHAQVAAMKRAVG